MSQLNVKSKHPRSFDVRCKVVASDLAEAELAGKLTANFFVSDLNEGSQNFDWVWDNLSCIHDGDNATYSVYFMVHRKLKQVGAVPTKHNVNSDTPEYF